MKSDDTEVALHQTSGDCLVRAVAEDAVGALFAGAEIHGAVFFGGVGNG